MTARMLGRFEIIREIGKGAMGVVYLAHDPKIDRNIAIKTVALPAGVSEDEARETRHRFVREAQAAGKLAHPNIITIYDVVEEKDLSYIAMEYIEGETLEAYTKPGALLPLNRVLPLLAQACSALDYAHKNQVIHRDIKPANLMLMKGDLLKITDFGLAKSPQANLTQAGVLIGTPNYMSPEQIAGRPMDGRSDFFSLGVVMYELLTGERPFSGDTISTIIYRILYEEPRPPRILNSKLPPAFDGIIKRALAKEPSERFQTGAEFLDALNNYSSFHLKSPISATAPTLKVGRDAAGPQPVPRDRPRPALRPVVRPRSPLFAGQPVKIAAVCLIAMMAVLFFPRRVQEMGKGASGTGAMKPAESQNETAAGFSVPSLGAQASIHRRSGESTGMLPAAPLPGNQAQVKTLAGTTLYLDNLKLNDPVVKLAEDDTKEHTLVAVNGCRELSILIQGSKLKPDLDMQDLKPKVGDLKIDSKPPHAQVMMDSKPLGPAPQIVKEYNACEDHTFLLKKENYKEFLRHFDGTVPWNEISDTMGGVALSEIPPGYAKFDALPSYPIEVVEGKNLIQPKDGVYSLPEGVHELTLRSPKVFFSRSIKVEITGSKSISLKQEWPGTGSITIQAEPSNCKIYVDGEYLDYPPINGHEIVAGTHRIRAVPDNDPSQARDEQVTIEAGKSRVQTFTFNH
jgi:predicted Ser/Thr protein kinase